MSQHVIHALIAAHNEESAIGPIAEQLMRAGFSVTVVASACTDNTSGICLAAGVSLINEPLPGKGRALRKGWSELLKRTDWEALLLLDGDGQHNPLDAGLLIDAWLKRNSDVLLVIGSRFPFRHPMPYLRRLTNRLMSYILSRRYSVHLPDSQSGYRLITRALVEKGCWTANHFQIESEMIREAIRIGGTVSSTPIKCHYHCRIKSSVNMLRDTYRWLRWLVGS